MPFCIYCGHQLADDAKFCSECGKPTNISNQNTQRKTVYDGEIHKCPNCGEILNSFASNCTSCGYELRDAKNSNAVREFALKLEQIEKSRNINSNGFSGLKNKINQLSSVNPIDEQKISLIRSFAIPNTKEDIYEFMILASSNIDVKLYGVAYDSSQFQGMMATSQKAVSDAWLAKFEQAYQKAQILLIGSQELLVINELYKRKIKDIKRKKIQFPLMWIGVISLLLFLFLLFTVLID